MKSAYFFLILHAKCFIGRQQTRVIMSSRKEAQALANKFGMPVLVKKVHRPRRRTHFIEPLSFDQARERVSEYMQKRGTVWVSELHTKLHIDLGTLSEVIGKLREEGHIAEVNE